MLRILCALALLFLGLAHKPAVIAEPQDSLILSYQLPDGTAPDLCIPQAPEKQKFAYPACDACRLTAGVALPEAPEVASYPLAACPPVFRPLVEANIALEPTGSHLARGPPSFPIV